MYDNEDEIKKKRRKLFIIIAVIVLIIIILLIFLLTRGGNKKPVNENKELKCELEVKSGTLGENGVYTSAVEIGFKSITAVSKDIEITKNTVGVNDNSRNKETFTVTKQGTYTVYGYIQDAAGNKGTCSIEVKVDPSKPTCELEVKKGTLGNNDWYTTDVEVGFKSMETNSETAKIEKFYLEKEVKLENDEVVRAETPTDNIDKLIIKDNQTTVINGYVIDSNGTEGSCTIVIKKDSEKPTCKLKVISGTKNNKGQYTDTAVVGLETAKDNTSDIAEKGVGVSKNYKEQTYAVTKSGTTTVYGYVKDKAGNEGTCSIAITKPTPVSPPKPVVSNPTCTINVTSGTLSNGQYTSNVTVSLSYSSTNNAKITKYGIGTKQELNGKNSYTVSSNGTVKLIGYVQDSNGKTATCTKTITVKKTEYALLSSQVKVGDYVAYNAGAWDSTVKIPTESGKFGGYTAGTNRMTGVTCGLSGEKARSGWQVMSVSNGKVVLIHSGTPECFYYNKATNSSTALAKISERAAIYKNATYAESARIFTYSEAKTMKEESLITGTYYYLAGEAKGTDTLWAVRSAYYQGRTLTGRSNYAQGIRPVVVLKSNVRTTGKTESGWVLTTTVYKDAEFELNIGITFDRFVEIANNTTEIVKNSVQ